LFWRNKSNTNFSFFDHAKIFCDKEIVLREHFRCMPEIIAFCNKLFYAPDGKDLYPLKQYSENRLEPLQSVYCENGYTDSSDSNISNKEEAKAIADKIAELIKNGKYREKSFGVITLQGNKQAELIDNLIKAVISDEEYNSRQIKCGNSANFQGDERDIMFLSLVTANNHNRSAFTNPEDERRFNVAVSRAKEQVWLFHSVSLAQLINNKDLRYKLLDHVLNYKDQQQPINIFIPRTDGNQPSPFDSWFEVDVFNDIVNHRYSVIPQYKVAQYKIDLVILLPNGVKIAIECDGDKFHTREDYEKDMYRQKVLERCGWQFFRVRGSEYYYNRITALEPLWKLLIKNEVKTPEPEIINVPNDEPVIVVIEPENPKEVKQPAIEPIDKPDITKLAPIPKQRFPLKNGIKKSKNLFSFSDILVFTSEQNVYKVKNKSFKTLSDIKIPLENGEKPVYVTGTDNYSGYLLVAFENGRIAKINLTSYKTEQNRKKLKNAYNAESTLIYIEHIDNNIDLIAASNIDKIILFNTELINPNISAVSQGIQVMKLQNNTVMKKVKTIDKVHINNPEFFRRTTLNAVGYNLKQDDKI
jgi:very-short-patch-repair endonuclease